VIAVTEPGASESPHILFDYALRLHRQFPDSPLPPDGRRLPDEWRHPRKPVPRSNDEHRRDGADIAELLDAHFARAGALPRDLASVLHRPWVPSHHNVQIAAAARRADLDQVHRAGRWLVRYGTDRCAVLVGLALLAESAVAEDIPLIQTIGLLSRDFGVLAVHALRGRRGGEAALIWLAARSRDWGRIRAVEALCEGPSPEARSWLLRHSCHGPVLAGYFAARVATAAHLDEAITRAVVDDELVDHTCDLLIAMANCAGTGATLSSYPPGPRVLAALAGHRGEQRATVQRFVGTAVLADHLASMTPEELGLSADQRADLVRRFLAVLDRDDWCTVVHAGLDHNQPWHARFEKVVVPRLPLRAYRDTA
jgi:hypothetical protein